MTGLDVFQDECGRDTLNSEGKSTEVNDGNYDTNLPSKNQTYRSIGIESFYLKELNNAQNYKSRDDADDNLKQL